MSSAVADKNRELVITRIFDAPRELAWQAWTDQARVAQWWGPKGFTCPLCELDVRPGGLIRIDMRAPDGAVYPMKGVFREIAAPEGLVFNCSALDREGKPMFEVLTTILFADKNGKTMLTMQAQVLTATEAAAPYLAGMEPGWTQTLDRLGHYITTMLK
jgi:uncharacterized protein YndB with AHSA1/START domain